MSNPITNQNPSSYCPCGKHHAGEISHQQMVAELRANPAKLVALVSGLSEAQLTQPAPDGRSIKTIIEHLCESTAIYIADTQDLLKEGQSVLGPSPEVAFDRSNVEAMLHCYAENEAQLADILVSLDDTLWQRGGIIRLTGQADIPLVVDDNAVHAVDHDREHLAEIEKMRASFTS